MRPPAPGAPLRRLAASRGVAASYDDAFGQRRSVSEETLVAVLAALGEPIERASDAASCLAGAEVAEALPPVIVAWEGRVPRKLGEQVATLAAGRSQEIALELEDGSEAGDLVPSSGSGRRPRLPFGLHRLRLGDDAALVVSAPQRCRPLEPHSWGVFAPAYALWDERDTLSGDLSHLARLASFAGALGAAYVATLPLLADYATADAPEATTSPYSPLSRMWWNEGYLDLAGALGLDPAELGAGGETGRTGTAGFADVAAAATAVRAGLAAVLQQGGPAAGRLRSGVERFRSERPDVTRYATFRAAARAAGIDRAAWPPRWRRGDIRVGRDVAAAEVELHECAQWLTDGQVAGLAAASEAAGCALMLDLPVGCRGDGYDTWAFPSSFAGGAPESHPGEGTTVGAPPDRFFSGGQDWGFRPLDPAGERRAGYPVVRGSLRHLLRHAKALRIDHVLGMQRLWWIPPGAAPSEGTYVSYPADELLALACLEAWRHGASLVGEDLGTVDPAVRRLMGEHGVAGMRVAVFELEGAGGAPLQPTAGSCALVDTHDTATFAGWLDGDDITARIELGLLDGAAARTARRRRWRARRALVHRLGGRDDPRALHAALLEELGSSAAAVVIASLEDLWAEHDPQNIPGTVGEHRNFARRMAESLGAMEGDGDVVEPLRRLDGARRQAGGACEGAEAGKLST
ncbi:MAG: 4-alpha-glucanotransferase [Acidimicrobiales bacterium]|jgi:4-alpha-glucanotransferase